MSLRVALGVFYIFVSVQYAVGDTGSRHKRCIVIQKQSGSRGDSAEGEDDDYRRPQPKRPLPDRLWKPQDKVFDAEEILPEFQRIKKRFDKLKLKNPIKFFTS